MALIPPFFLDCVVAIGVATGAVPTKWVASGFIYAEFVKKNDDNSSRYVTYLVTNRHVVEKLQKIRLRFNPVANQPAQEFDFDLVDIKGNPTWFAPADPEADVIAAPIDVNALQRSGIRYAVFRSDSHVADRKMATSIGISEGDGVFTLGFPLELVGGERNFVIVRQGSIARIGDVLAGSGREFLIDSLIFPGNSGGPVVLKAEAGAIDGTRAQNKAYLIGVVRSFIAYREVAVSEQTGRPRVVFEENSGLAAVVLLDYVNEAIALHRNKLGAKYGE